MVNSDGLVRLIFPIRVILTLGLLLCVPALAAAPVNETAFHIKAKPLTDALVDLAIQARLSIGRAGLDLRGIAGHPVDGKLSATEALDMLLAGSGFGYVMLDPQTVQIRPLAQPIRPAKLTQTIEDIIVTASKRPLVAQSMPNSIAVISSSQLNDSGTTADNGLAGHTAALTATNLGAGQDKIFIRGLSDSVFTGRSESMVGLYLDETRVTDDAPDPGLRLVDIDQVEVIRGPQGTLYGAGTLGGLVRVITNKPVMDQFSGRAGASVSITEDGGPSTSADGMINLPIIANQLALRAVGYTSNDGGYINDVRLGLKNVNHTVTDGGRLALRWAPTQDWSVTLGGTAQKIIAADSQYSQLGLAPYERTNYLTEPHKDAFLQGNLAVEAAFDWGQLTSNSAVTHRHIDNQYDATLGWTALTGFPTAPSRFIDHRIITTETHETRLSSPDQGSWQWLGGVFLSHRDETYRSALTGLDSASLPVTARSERREDSADEAALFAETSYWPTDWLSLTAGARLFYAAISAQSQIDLIGAYSPSLSHGNNGVPELTRKAVISLHPDEGMTFYGSAAEGFRLGGIDINSPTSAVNVNARGGDQSEPWSVNAFNPDTLWTFETGAKISLLNGLLIANAATYVTYWTNVQSDQILPDGSLYIANIGNVRDPGFELDSSFQVTPGVLLRGNFFWNDPKIVHVNPAFIQTEGRLPGVPENSVGLSLHYDLPLSDDINGFFNAGYSYVGSSHIGFDQHNSPAMGNYYTGNLRLGLAQAGWQAVLYVENIANEHANSFAYGNPFSFNHEGQITPLRPLTTGLGISRNF